MDIRVRTLIAVAIAITAVAIGCGSDSSSEENSGGPAAAAQAEDAAGDSLGKAEFVSEANASCKEEREKALDRATAYVEEHRSDGLPEAVLNERSIKAGLLGSYKAEMDALRALGAPDGDEEQIEEILATFETDLEKAKKVKPKDLPEDFEKQFGASDALLRSYGLADCAKLG